MLNVSDVSGVKYSAYGAFNMMLEIDECNDGSMLTDILFVVRLAAQSLKTYS